MQTDTTRLAVASGQIVIPMMNGILALVSGKTLKFYSWIDRFAFLAGVSIDGSHFTKDSNITVTHDDKILVTKSELSLHVYSLKRSDTKNSVTFRTLMRVDRTKEWVESHMVNEPYYIGQSTTNKSMMFYIDTGESTIFAAVDVGINVADYRFWSVFRNRAVVYDYQMRKLFYFALIGGAHTSSVMLADGAEPRENNIIGTAMSVFCGNCSYVFWNIDTTFDCIHVDSDANVVLLGDKYALITVDSFAICDSRNSRLSHSIATARLLHSANVLATWMPPPEVLASPARTEASPRSPANSARSVNSTSGASSVISQSIDEDITPPPRKRSPSISCDAVGEDAPQTRACELSQRISIPKLTLAAVDNSTTRVKLVSPHSARSARGHRRTPSGNPIRDALVKRNSRNQILSSMGKLLMQDHDSGDLIVGLTEKI